jgi:hypothetical protein
MGASFVDMRRLFARVIVPGRVPRAPFVFRGQSQCDLLDLAVESEGRLIVGVIDAGERIGADVPLIWPSELVPLSPLM